jgi:nucleotidyltransferase substrate binding protein (TIGR01987 family)
MIEYLVRNKPQGYKALCWRQIMSNVVDYSNFQKSLKHLALQYENLQTLDSGYPALIKQGIQESVILRFETCYDCLWKVLKRYLQQGLGLADVPNSPKPIFRTAHENQLLPSAIESWLGYAQARINTAHDYSGEKSQMALNLMQEFVVDAIALYQNLTGKVWHD